MVNVQCVPLSNGKNIMKYIHRPFRCFVVCVFTEVVKGKQLLPFNEIFYVLGTK